MESPTWWESFLTPSGANSSSELYNTYYHADDVCLQKILTNQMKKIRPIRTILAACMVTYIPGIYKLSSESCCAISKYFARKHFFFQMKPLILSFRRYSVKHLSIVVVDTLDSDHSCTHCFLREHLGLLDERTLRKDIDVQDPVCDEFYQTWVNSAKKNLDIYEEVSQSVCLSVCPFICDIYLWYIHNAIERI